MATATLDEMVAVGGELVGGDAKSFFAEILDGLDRIAVAEAEVDKAQFLHPDREDLIFHSFSLLRPNPELSGLGVDSIYRAHCRELLGRVANGEDTRPGTAAEVVCAIRMTSRVAPLKPEAFAVYARVWRAAGLWRVEEFEQEFGGAYRREMIDFFEQLARLKMQVEERRLGPIRCCGYHHGEEVDCVYARSSQLEIEG